MNQFTLIGRVTKDPEIQTTRDGISYTRFTLAVRRPFKNSRGEYDTDFISMVSWKKLAERVADYCAKGSLVSVNGRIVMRALPQNGEQKITVPDMVAENVGFLHLKRHHPKETDTVPLPDAVPGNPQENTALSEPEDHLSDTP